MAISDLASGQFFGSNTGPAIRKRKLEANLQQYSRIKDRDYLIDHATPHSAIPRTALFPLKKRHILIWRKSASSGG